MSGLAELSGPILPALWARGVWFSRAAFTLGTEDLREKCQAAADEFRALGEGETVETFPMCTDLTGEARDHYLLSRLHGKQQAAWRRYRNFSEQLETSLAVRLGFNMTLVACGAPGHAGAAPQWIAPQAWHFLHRDPDQKDVVRGENIVWWYVKVFEPGWLTEPAALPVPIARRAKPLKGGAEVRREFKAWAEKHPDETARGWDRWSTSRGYSTTVVRKLRLELKTKLGRRSKTQSRTSAHE